MSNMVSLANQAGLRQTISLMKPLGAATQVAKSKISERVVKICHLLQYLQHSLADGKEQKACEKVSL
jgi:hypothetical protein